MNAAAPIRGRVAAVRGTVLEIDVEGAIPAVSAGLECLRANQSPVIAVVQAHVGAARVRAIAVDSTRGLACGAEVRSSGLPILAISRFASNSVARNTSPKRSPRTTFSLL